jgi:hypothetical protein
MDSPLLIDLIHGTQSMLRDMRELSRLTREKFVDKEFEEFFQTQMSNLIEPVDLLLDGYLNHVRFTTAVTKKDTVNTLIEKALEKHRHEFEEKKITVFKNLEKGLPEIVVPDEHLAFIVDSIVLYAVVGMPLGGAVLFSTSSSFVFPRPTSGAAASSGEDYSRKSVEISVAFIGAESQMRMELKSQGETALNLLLRLVDAVVQQHKGTMENISDKKKESGHIALKFPFDRRQKLDYQPVDS